MIKYKYPDGVLAHLVERFHGMEEVRSSNLLYSTSFLCYNAGVGGRQFNKGVRKFETAKNFGPRRYEELRKIIPDFDALCHALAMAMLEAGRLAYVPRMGDAKFGLTPFFPEGEYIGPDKQISTLEHTGIMCIFTELYVPTFGPYYPHLFGWQPDWDFERRGIAMHDISEKDTLDVTDDNDKLRTELCKDERELEIFRKFISEFPASARTQLEQAYARMQKKSGYMYCLDKWIFVYDHFFFKWKYDKEGTYDKAARGYLGKSDDEDWIALTGSKRPVDNLFAKFLVAQSYMALFDRPFFIGITEQLYDIVYHEPVPESVARFYH